MQCDWFCSTLVCKTVVWMSSGRQVANGFCGTNLNSNWNNCTAKLFRSSIISLVGRKCPSCGCLRLICAYQLSEFHTLPYHSMAKLVCAVKPPYICLTLMTSLPQRIQRHNSNICRLGNQRNLSLYIIEFYFRNLSQGIVLCWENGIGVLK